jgi:hypothetical protein
LNDVECRRVRDVLPERVRLALDAETAAWVDAHVSRCAACATELALVAAVTRATPSPPRELSSRVAAALREASGVEGYERAPGGAAAAAPMRAGGKRLAWAVAAAATVVLAVGTSVTLRERRPERPSEAELWQAFLEERTPPPWTADDGLVAGAPVLVDLSQFTDEDLELVLEEMGP